MPADDAVPLTIDIFTTACDDVQTIKHASTYLQQVRRNFIFSACFCISEHHSYRVSDKTV